jgi:hypothetical protein
MPAIIRQRIPGGCQTPEEQVDVAQSVIRNAAALLEFSGLDQLERAMRGMRKPLVTLTAAGVLSEIAFLLQDPQGVCGVAAAFHCYAVEEFEAVDLSALRLLANPESRGKLQIACVDGALAAAIVEAGWLPPASTFLDCRQVSRGGGDMESKFFQEDTNEHDNEYNEHDGYEGYSESAGEISDLYGQLTAPDRLQD